MRIYKNFVACLIDLLFSIVVQKKETSIHENANFKHDYFLYGTIYYLRTRAYVKCSASKDCIAVLVDAMQWAVVKSMSGNVDAYSAFQTKSQLCFVITAFRVSHTGGVVVSN